MERHEIDDELASTGAQQLLTSSSMARLAYLATDATPRVIPIAFYWTGEQVVVSTATGCATTTSAPADFRESCRSWSSGPGDDGVAAGTRPGQVS
jgi:hypothetical protein